jgi:YVTN family beta-propeller protein
MTRRRITMHSLKRVTLHSILVSVLIMLSMAAMTLGARPAGADPFAYVTNFKSGTLSVISIATNMVVATIPVGSNPHDVAITPEGQLDSGTVSVISTASNTVVATIPAGTTPLGVGHLNSTPL